MKNIESLDWRTDEGLVIETNKPDLSSKERFKAYKMKLHEEMLKKQRLPYSIKVLMAKDRIRDFYNEALKRGYNTHVSVGGLDSIVLGHLISDMGYTADEVPFVSASTLEDISIQKIHEEMGCIVVKPLKSKATILQEEGSLTFKNFPQVVVIHTVKAFGVIKKRSSRCFSGTFLLF